MIRLLVFPCGSEIGLEIHRSLGTSRQVSLIGASSVDDHGRFVFEDYVGGLPMADETDFIDEMAQLVMERSVDAIYPAMDSVISVLKRNESRVGCRVIAPDAEVAEICLSKRRTYSALSNHIRVPTEYENPNKVKFPAFLKPEIGYGARGTAKVSDMEHMMSHLSSRPDCMILEYLPGREFTVDCFTSRGSLLFAGPRQRTRLMNGISVNTRTMTDEDARFRQMAVSISEALPMDGAWFFQAKEDNDGQLVLMEVACRFAGSSCVYRAQGVNFALLSVLNAFGHELSVMPSLFDVELDRSLSVRFKTEIDFDQVYVDYDDTLVCHGRVNSRLVAFIHDCINRGKRITLLSRHRGDLEADLRRTRLSGLFDEVVHVTDGSPKSWYIMGRSPLFIDDSFLERREVHLSGVAHTMSPDTAVDLIFAHTNVQNY